VKARRRFATGPRSSATNRRITRQCSGPPPGGERRSRWNGRIGRGGPLIGPTLSCLGHNVNQKADEVLDYATPGIAKSRWPFFVGGVVVAEVISVVLLSVLQGGGPIFPFTVLFAPVAVIVEMIGSDRALYFGLFVGAPLLYGLYGSLLAFPRRLRNLSIAAVVHLVCFAITLGQRAVFSVL
jgi:hypothetical protein